MSEEKTYGEPSGQSENEQKPCSPRLYPAGIQTFSKIREDNYVYVDKTGYIRKMMQSGMQYVFLSRPRRFGKSLFVSTLESYFEGRKELFQGLEIEKAEKEWEKHPVLHFDFSSIDDVESKEDLINELSRKLAKYERIYGRDEEAVRVGQRLSSLIERAYEKEHKKVVVLIDEYDTPLLEAVHNEQLLPALRKVMQGFYKPLKSCDQYLRFVFLTGITKFSQLSIFSALNNIVDISLHENYAAICGITEQEIREQMSEDVDILAEKLGTTREDTLRQLKEMYDGYHFAWPSPDIYNPFSLINAFLKGGVEQYWFASGTPTYLIEMMRKYKVSPDKIGGRRAKASTFDAPTERMTEITPLLYQSGYITITDCSPDSKTYSLDIPNEEVRVGLMESLLANYVQSAELADQLTDDLTEQIREGRLDDFMQTMQKVLAAIPYTSDTDYEGHYQAMFCMVFALLEANFDAEKRTADGRIDLVLQPRGSEGPIYIFELKLDKSPEEALRQIEEKRYAAHFALSGRPVIKVGVNIDSSKRNISGWQISD